MFEELGKREGVAPGLSLRRGERVVITEGVPSEALGEPEEAPLGDRVGATLSLGEALELPLRGEGEARGVKLEFPVEREAKGEGEEAEEAVGGKFVGVAWDESV